MGNEVVDFFFLPHPSTQERRLRAAITDGLAHGSRIEPHDPLPGEAVTLLLSSNVHQPIEEIAVYYTTDGTEPVGTYGVVTNGQMVRATRGDVIHDVARDLHYRQWRALLPAQVEGTLVQYRVDGWNPNDERQHWYADRADPVSQAPANGRCFAYHVDRWTSPPWWDDALVYQVFVDRFNAATGELALREHDDLPITGFFGGTLAGIQEKLDYIQALGANCIWLSPLFESPTHHGYNPSDHYTVAARYGTNATLRELIAESHRRGMRVMLDFVANHTSDEHPSFVAARNRLDDTSAHWYAIDANPPYSYRSYAAVKDMPELLTDHPDVRNYLFAVAQHWLSDFGADALRLDYVPGPSHAFWTLFQRAIKQSTPQAVTIGEITGSLWDVTNYAGRMDGFMDFPLARVLRDVFAQRTMSLQQLLAYLEERQRSLPATMRRATLLDNHDMHRFLWLANGATERLKLAAACQMTLEGTPIVYYGTEVGLSQYDDAYRENAYARAPMFWDERQDLELLDYFRRLGTLRQSHAVLRHGRTTILSTELVIPSAEQDQVGAYLRHLPDATALIALNNNEQPVTVRIPLPEDIVTPSLALHNLLAAPEQREVSLCDGTVEIELASLEAAICLSVSAPV